MDVSDISLTVSGEKGVPVIFCVTKRMGTGIRLFMTNPKTIPLADTIVHIDCSHHAQSYNFASLNRL